MIYEMVQGCMTTLQNRWTNLYTSLQALHNLLSTGGHNATAEQLRTDLLAMKRYIEDLAAQSPLEDGSQQFLRIQDMLSQANRMLDESRNLRDNNVLILNSIEALLDVQLNNGALRERGGDELCFAFQTAQNALVNLRRHIEDSLCELEELTTEAGARASLGGINRSVENISAYPVLTQEMSYTTPSTSGGGAVTARPLGQLVENTLRDVLGWRPKLTDHRGFVAALTQSFNCKEVEGRTECVYTPRTYAVHVQADLGALTGAQASIYARARVALEQSQLILARLHPLRSDADDEDVEAQRAIVRSLWTELVNELGVEGGPRVQRIDTYFEQLRGVGNGATDPTMVGGALRDLGNTLGLTPDQVNTVEEEQNLTDYLTLVDYVNSLYLSWENRRQFFDRSSSAQPFLGTQLVLVGRALNVVAESVQEVYRAMDSVFLGPGERQTIELVYNNPSQTSVGRLNANGGANGFAQFGGNGRLNGAPTRVQNSTQITVAELLAWVERTPWCAAARSRHKIRVNCRRPIARRASSGRFRNWQRT
jgi:hypothetical protein